MTFTRRSFIATLAAGVVASQTTAMVAKATSKPNIIFFLVDDMGWQDTSVPFYYRDGKAVKTVLNKRYHTPNMERLARKGMLFTSAYAQPLCTPTRSSLMSGMNSARTRITNWAIVINEKSENGKPSKVRIPTWASNGLQPPNTQPIGLSTPPYWAVKATDADKKPLPYAMTEPYTCAKGLPAFLKEAGYTTIHIGKAHYAASGYSRQGRGSGEPTPGADPKTFGFEYNVTGQHTGHPGSFKGKSQYGELVTPQAQWWIPGLDGDDGENYINNVFLTDALTTQALRTIDHVREKDPKKPFFMQVAHYAIHIPLDNARAWDESRSANLDPHNDPKNPNPNDGLGWNENERNYTVLLKGVDDSLGQIMDYLEAKGIDDQTAILFMSDNGGMEDRGRLSNANAPLRAGKGSCYDGGIREPMMVSWPGVTKPGSVCDTPVIIEDFFPTILDIAGNHLAATDPNRLSGLSTSSHCAREGWSDVPQVIDGKSFVPLLRGQPMTTERPLIFHYPHSWINSRTPAYDFYTAMRYGSWKFIYQHDTATFELYDLSKDIGESHNLVKDQPEQAKSLAKIMGNELRRMKAQMPICMAGNPYNAPVGAPIPWPDDVIR